MHLPISLYADNFALFDLVDTGVLVVESQTVLFANQTFTHQTGTTREELIGQQLGAITDTAWQDLSLGQNWADALPWPTRGGGTLWFEVTPTSARLDGRDVLVMTCTNVTARMRAEGAEASMLQMISEIIEGSPVGTFVIDENHLVTQWNRACEALTGMPAAEIVGSDEIWRAFKLGEARPMLADWVMSPVDEEALRQLYPTGFWKSPTGHNTYEAELFFPHLGDTGRWIHFAATPLRDANGNIVGAIETLVDVTQRMQMEQILAQTIAGVPIGMFVLDVEHRVRYWNRVCEGVSGVAASQIVGHKEAWRIAYDAPRPTLADLVLDRADAATFSTFYPDCKLQQLGDMEDSWLVERYFPAMGAHGTWLTFTAAPVRDDGGHIIAVVQTVQDISEQKENERLLDLARQSAEQLVAERTLELESAKSALEIDVARRKEAEAELLRHLSELTSLNMQLHDTQEKLMQSQQQLVQSEKMASIGQLAAGVAHEINNPIGYVFSNFGSLQTYLADILGLLERYIEAEAHLDQPPVREALQGMRKKIDLDFLREDILSLMNESREGIERVRKIVQDLKEFSHVDASPDWQWVDLHRGLESTLNIAHNEIKYRAEVIREFGQLPQILCLPSQLNQVFMNILVNAAHAMEGRERGTITVRTGTENGGVWVDIADNGCGMPPEVMGRIFDPFFTTKAVGKGTGLGLSLSYGIVQKHHGHINVCSEPGQGTTFHIWLPVNQPQENAQEAA